MLSSLYIFVHSTFSNILVINFDVCVARTTLSLKETSYPLCVLAVEDVALILRQKDFVPHSSKFLAYSALAWNQYEYYTGKKDSLLDLRGVKTSNSNHQNTPHLLSSPPLLLCQQNEYKRTQT